MTNKNYKNFSLYTVGNLLPKVFSFILLPIYTKYLNPSDYGIVNSMDVFSGFLVVFFTLSIERSIYRLYYDYKTEEEKRTYLGTIAISFFVLSTIILLVLFIFNNNLSLIFKSIPFYPYYLYAIITSYLSVYSIIPRIYYQIKEKADWFLTVSIIQMLANVLFVLWFVVYKNEGAIGMLKGTLYGTICTLPIFIYITSRVINLKFRLSVLRDSLVFSIPMFPVIISSWILNFSDRIFIEHYFSTWEVGIYSLGFKLASLVLIVVSALDNTFNPVFYRIANEVNQSESIIKLKKLANYYFYITISICCLIALFSKEVIEILFNERYLKAFSIVPLLCLSYLISLSSGIFNMMIYQEKKTKLIMVATIFGATISILLNFIFIPRIGVYGAALSAIISYIITFLIKYNYAKKCYYIPIDWKYVLPFFLIAIALVSVFIYIDIENLYVSVFVKFFVVLLLILLYIVKYNNSLLIRIRDFRSK